MVSNRTPADDGGVGIAAIEIAMPDTRLGMEDILDGTVMAARDRETARALGITEVRAAGVRTAADVETYSHELAARAGRALLARTGLPADGLDALIHIPSRVPHKLMTSEVTRMQAALGAERAACLSVGDLGCASSSAAVLTAWSLLRAHQGWSNILITHGSVAPTPQRYRAPVTVSGDAGLAILLNRSPRYVVSDVRLRSDGRYWDLFAIDHLGGPWSSWAEQCKSEHEYSFTLAVRSGKLLQELAAHTLADLGASLTDVRHVIMQNLSIGAFHFYEQALGRPVSPVCSLNLRRYGHLGAADVFVNLASLNGQTSRDDLVLILNNSPSAAWSVTVLTAV